MTKHERFPATEAWSLQAGYKEQLHERIQRWGERVAPLVTEMSESNTQPEEFFKYLMESVIRDDSETASLIEYLDNAAMHMCEGYGSTPGSINSTYGEWLCKDQFMGLYAIFEAGQRSATNY